MAVRARHAIEVAMKRLLVAASLAALLAACAGGPPPPDWQANAKAAMDGALAAYLSGDARAEARDFALARSELARTGRADLLARAELMRCAAHVAALVFEPCEAFGKLRADAGAAERAYADFLAGQIADVARLPPAQRAAATAIAGGGASLTSLSSSDDALSQLVSAALLFQAGKASPALIAQAVDVASAQGWRRPLLAWLNVQALRAERAGDSGEAQRVRRRIELVLNTR